MTEETKKSIITDLWERRVPQFLATYVGFCWAFIQVLLFCSDRYGVDSSYIERFIIFALILTPAVVVFTYNHGAPGRDEWKNYEKYLIPANFVVALLFASLFGGVSEMNAAPTEVTVTTETGDTITRMVPALEQTKSFAVFPFLNKSGRDEENWQKYAIPNLLRMDMEQDIRFYCLDPFSFDYSLESNNHTIEDNNIPFVTYNKIAKDKIVDYFVTGEFDYEGENLITKIKIYETKTGEVFYEKEFHTNSIYEIVDQANSELGDNLYLENNEDKISFTDLPASNLVTGNIEALEQYYKCRMIRNQDEDYPGMMAPIQTANELDPGSASLKFELAIAHNNNNNIEAAKVAIGQALDYSEGLPERQKFRIKQYYYRYNANYDKFIPLLESWKKLYPNDYYPYNSLIGFYMITQNTKKAKATGEDALKNGHGSRVLKRLAEICIGRKEFEEAEKYIDEYYKVFPDKKREEDVQLADIYVAKGEFDKAKEWYESISLINPNDHDITIKLATVYSHKGEFDKAEKSLEDALRQCKLRADSLGVYIQKALLYYRTGQVRKFVVDMNNHFELTSPGENKMEAAAIHIQLSSLYGIMGQEDLAYDKFKYIEKYASHYSGLFSCLLDFQIGTFSNDLKKFRRSTEEPCRSLLTQNNATFDYLLKGFEYRTDKNHSESIRYFEMYLDTTEANKDNFGGLIAEQYRLSGEYKKSIEYCLESMKLMPFEGTFLLELAKSYKEDGQIAKAKEAMETLKNKVWNKAEPEYLFYDDMMALASEFELE